MKVTSSPTTDGGFADRISGFGRSAIRLSWPFRPALLDAVWAVFSVINLIAIFAFPGWETVPFHLIWISVTLLYGFRVWAPRPTLLVLAVVMVLTAAGIGQDVLRGAEPAAELTEVPLMAAMFLAMVWHARRKLTAEQESRLVSEENAGLLATQRRFLQDASHQLRTPITIALGHAELLASGLTSRQEGHDIQVVLGELNRLRRIAERLLVIAAAEGPEFLHPEPVALDSFIMEILRRWRPTADRRWQLGKLDKVTVPADRERLGLAIDALLENAVRHTASGDVSKVVGRGGRVRSAGPHDRQRHGPGHPGRVAAARLRQVPQRRQRAGKGNRTRARAGARGRPGARRGCAGAQQPRAGQRVRGTASRQLGTAGAAGGSGADGGEADRSQRRQWQTCAKDLTAPLPGAGKTERTEADTG